MRKQTPPGATDADAPEAATGTRPSVVLTLVCTAQFMVMLDATVVNVALPSIERGLGFSPSGLQWVISAYVLAIGGLLLLGGRASDLFGRRRVFALGVAGFTIASVACGLAQDSSALIVGRVVQGAAAAALTPAALGIITATFSGTARDKALGIFSGLAVLGGTLGVVTGGLLTDWLSWRWVFLINVPFGIACLLLTPRCIPPHRPGSARGGFDVAGAVSITGSLVALTYAVVKAIDWGWTSGSTLALLGVAVVLLLAFILIERRAASPLMPLSILANRPLRAGNLVLLLQGAELYSLMYFLSLYLQQVLGYSPLRAGFAFLPLGVGSVFGVWLTNVLVPRIGAKPVLLMGQASFLVGGLLLLRVPADGDFVSDVLPPSVALFFASMSYIAALIAANAGVRDGEEGLAGGIAQTSVQIGAALGVAVLGTLAGNRTAELLRTAGDQAPATVVNAVNEGFQFAFGSGLVFPALGILVGLVLLRARDLPRERPSSKPHQDAVTEPT